MVKLLHLVPTLPPTTHDVFIRLDAGNPESLGVTIINQVTLDVQFSDIPVIPFAYGFADHIINLDIPNTVGLDLGTALITNGTFGPTGGGKLTYLSSADGGITWNSILLASDKSYTNAQIIITDPGPFSSPFFSNNFAVLGLNTDTNAIDAYLTVDGGQNFNPQGPVVHPPVITPFRGGVAFAGTSDGQGGYNLLYGRPTSPTDMDVIIGNTTTGFEQVVDTDQWEDAVLRDGTAAQNGDFNVATVYNGNWNSYHAYTYLNSFGQPGAPPAETNTLGDAGNFNSPGQQGFTSVSAACTPSNNQEKVFAVAAPSGKTWHIGFDASPDGGFTVDIVQSPQTQDPTGNTQGGPINVTKVNFFDISDPTNPKIIPGNSVSFNQPGNSFVYAQCVFLGQTGIPTLSEWGLIAMAGILGIVGFIVLRRRKVAA